jgi:hypothetical protein
MEQPMTDVRTTVTSALSSNGLGGYASQAVPVVNALVEREQGIASRIIEFAGEKGLSEEQARAVLSDLGMEVPPVATPEPVETGGGATLDSIAATLASLVAFARRNGYTG